MTCSSPLEKIQFTKPLKEEPEAFERWVAEGRRLVLELPDRVLHSSWLPREDTWMLQKQETERLFLNRK